LAICSTPVTDSRSNETLLFSITKPADIDLVAKEGFVKANGYFFRKKFGSGVYFTDNAINGAACICAVTFFFVDNSQRTINRTFVARPTQNSR
jgi:hypothetical protein